MSETNQPIEPTLEVLPPSAMEAIERAAVDVQISTAHRFPRSLEQFKKRSLAMATFDIETAESCIYSRPVGKDPDTGKQKIAEGESIRMAEIVAATFGNLRVAARIVEQTPTFVRCEGVAHDLESNYAGKSEVMESTVNKRGQPYSERQRAVVAKVALSKAYRDAIFRVVPKSMCKFLKNAAQEVIKKERKTIGERRAVALKWIASLGIEPARVYDTLGIKGESDIGEEQLEILTGLRTAIKDNEITVDEAFPLPERETPQPTFTAPPSTKEELFQQP